MSNTNNKTNNKNPDLFVDIVSKAQEKKRINSMVEAYNNSINNSVVSNNYVDTDDNIADDYDDRIEYGEKKKKKTSLVQKALITIAILAVLFLAGVLAKATTDYITDIISDNATYAVYSDIIDGKIDEYVKLMDHTGKEGERIETAYGYNETSKEAYVNYSPGILADHIANSMNGSEVETRCVILAAYKVINTPYREDVFGKAFSAISNDEKYKDMLPEYLNVHSFDEYIKTLGYEDIEDYHKNERQNIKKLCMVNGSTMGEENGRKRV